MLNTVVSSDSATLANDPTLLNRFTNSQIHKFSHTFFKGLYITDGWNLGSHDSYICLVPVVTVCTQCVIVTLF